jgi:hypothetical protein
MHNLPPTPHARRLVVGAACVALAALGPRVASAQTRAGLLTAVWDAGASTLPRFTLLERDGTSTPLAIDAAALASAGGVSRVDRQEVLVEAEGAVAGAGSPRRVRSLRLAAASAARTSLAPLPTATAAAAPIGALNIPSKPFITLLCRFADTPNGELPRREDVVRAHGGGYPGPRHFFAEQAFGSDVLAGSDVAPAWVTVGPRGRYVSNEVDLDTYSAARDCVTASEAAGVRVSGYFGINLQFSAPLSRRGGPPYDPLSLGGSFSRSSGDRFETFGATWLSSVHVSNYVVLEHEMGHAFGWPHSEFAAGSQYDSQWDVMSAGYIGHDPEFGSMPSGTIGVNKQNSGWAGGGATAVPERGSARAVALRALARPWPDASDTSSYVARLQPAAGGCDYTVEARQRTGYDRFLPGSAVVVHQLCGAYPRLIGPPGARDGGATAGWAPGSMLADSLGGAYVRVDSATAAGYAVTVTRGWPLAVQVVTAGGTGSTVRVNGLTCGARCTAAAGARGDQRTVTPTAAAGSMFLGWGGACEGTGASCAVSMNGYREVSARFGAVVSIAAPAESRRAVVGTGYADTLRASGGTGQYSWAVTSGSLPAGLTLDGATGVVGGTPSASGTARVVIAATSLTSTATAAITIRVVRPTVVTSDSVRPAAVRGVAYGDTLRVDAEPGSVTWTVTDGALPDGLALDAATGRLAGVPTTVGTARFTATASADGVTGARRFVRRVRRPTVVVGDSVRPAAVVGVAYADTLRAEAETDAPLGWAVTAGSLPPGLSLDGRTGVVSGVATEAASATFAVTATAGGLSGSRTFTLLAVRTTIITSDSLRRRGTVGVAYADTLRASNALAAGSRWVIAAGALPAGLVLDSLSGVLTGTPTAGGTARFAVAIVGEVGPPRRDFVMQILKRTSVVGASTRRTAVRGFAYADTLRADGEPGPVRWEIADGALPAGLALNAATGVVSGTATTLGVAQFAARASSELSSDTRALVIAVVDGLHIASDSARPAALVGEPYADTLRIAEVGHDVRWSVVEGALPPGLALSAESGLLSGTAERAGSFRFTVLAAGPTSDRRGFTLAVSAPAVAAADVLDQLLGSATALPPTRVAYLDLIGNRNGRLDVGDVRAWLVATGSLPASATPAQVVPALERAATRAAPQQPDSSTPSKAVP